MRTYENTCQDCGTTIAAMAEAEPGTSLCFPCATGSSKPNLVFVNLDTDTVEDLAGDAFVIDTETAALTFDPDDGWRWRADRGGWTHCDDRADYDDDGATCRKCYRFMSHDQAAERMIE